MLTAVLRNFVLPALLAMAPPAALQATSVHAQELHMNNSCPNFNDPSLHTMNKDQLIDACLNNKPVADEAVAAMDCNTAKTLAAYSRMDNSFVEGQVAEEVVAQQCGHGNGDEMAFGGEDVGFPVGLFSFERGYHTAYSGQKAVTCAPIYYGTARISKSGVITFTSGGHDWRGFVSRDGALTITHDGVSNPTPIHETAIIGPLENARLFNGYCGSGFFRLVAKL